MKIAALRQALQDPAVYPEPTTHVEVHETHISVVFLTDRYVYKIKKPVKLGFLDFSTQDRRRFYCDQELELNRRLSSGVYLEVVAIYRDGERCGFDGRGSVVDYALKMRRLCTAHCLASLLHHRQASPEHLEQLAQRLTMFHHTHPLPSHARAFDHLRQVRTDWEENFAQTIDYTGKTLDKDTYRLIRTNVTGFMEQRGAWFEQRFQAGRIRDCHGDLRAEHVYFEPHDLQIIDCIEFNRRFRYIDVASEIAFLAIDLERLHAADLAHSFLRAYVEQAHDLTLYRLLDFYRCYRAYVSGKVASMRLVSTPEEARKPQRHRLAEQFFHLAARYAARLARPLLLATTGPVASGKSTIAERVAAALDMRLLISERVGQELAARQTYDALAERARGLLLQGRSVLLDASFSTRAERQRMARLAKETEADYGIVACAAPATTRYQRLRQRERQPDTLADAGMDRLDTCQRGYEPVQADEAGCLIRLATTQPLEQCVQQALAGLEAQRD